ncbi:MAG: SIMPL domain-containing protein [Pseudomonadota bacterium]|nr:SIMPL domain-containing protein [Pseudomonadota bacterium]
MLTTLLYLSAPLLAAEIDTRSTLQISGVGEVYVAPDEAVLTLGVRAQGDTAASAFDAAAKKMEAVAQALASQVPPERIRTSQLSLQPRYEYDEHTGPRLVGYEASSILEIRVDDPMAAGAVLDATVSAGANEVLGVAWKVEDEDAVRQQALEAAVADARTYAEQVATELGVSLGDPMRISIRTQDTTPPGPVYMERAAQDADIASMPVMSGEQIYRAEVDVTFETTGGAPATPPDVGPELEPEPGA